MDNILQEAKMDQELRAELAEQQFLHSIMRKEYIAARQERMFHAQQMEILESVAHARETSRHLARIKQTRQK